MAVPTLKVEVAFDDDPLDTSATWTDISTYVMDGSMIIRRGRVDPWSPFTAGRARFKLKNGDRRFDPKYTAGPYYGKLKPKRQIRITATYSSTDYRMFTGWVTSWPQDYILNGRYGEVEIVAYDALEWCAGVRLSSDPLYDYITDTNITRLNWLRQSSGDKWQDLYDERYGATRVGPAQTPAASLAPGLKSSAVAFGGQNYYSPSGLLVCDGTWAVTFWMQSTGVSQTITDYYDTSADERRWLSIDADGCLKYHSGTTSNYSTLTTTVRVNDGQPHYVVLYSASPDATFYVDGQEITTTTTNYGTGDDFANYFASVIGATTPTTSLYSGVLQDLTVFSAVIGGDVPITATHIATIYAIGIGIVPETSEDRMARYLDDAGWPSAWRDISTNTRATCGTLAYNGQELLTALRELEATEQGKVFAAKDGNLTLLARYAHQEVTRNSTVQATFSDDGSDFKYETFSWVEDDTNVRNDITVQTATMQSRSQDATSQTAYGRRSETVNTVLSTYEQCRDMAAGLVYWWKDAAVRVDPFDVKADPSITWSTLLNLELGDKVQAEITPVRTGSQSVFPLLVDSIEWKISNRLWRMTIGGSPVPTSFFMLGTSSLDGADVLGF